jgi:Ca2+-binding EF-hand superfamily protein
LKLVFLITSNIIKSPHQDGFIDFKEFGRLIDLLYYYNELFQIFKKLDLDNDRRISFAEFKKGHKIIGFSGLSNAELKEQFDDIDTNQGGFILFDEVNLKSSFLFFGYYYNFGTILM